MLKLQDSQQVESINDGIGHYDDEPHHQSKSQVPKKAKDTIVNSQESVAFT